jgi:aerobic carbon-monoxide dehydrogenase large subunit
MIMPYEAHSVGQPVPSLRAEQLIRGRGSYLADLHQPGELHVAILRSSQPHARIRSIDTEAARALPGVALIVTGADLLDVAPQVSLVKLPGQRDPQTRCLAVEVVRFVGEPLAAVVATDPFIAEDARDLIRVEYAPLPALANADAALAPDAPRLYADWPDNVVASMSSTAGDAAQALATADLLVHETFRTPRVAPLPMECRGVLAMYDPSDGSLMLWSSTQAIHQVRRALAQMLHLAEHRIRVIAPSLGGGFGAKAYPIVEEALVAALAVRLGRPVRWIEDRNESLLAMNQARDEAIELELGLRRDGTIAGLRARIVLDCGATPYITSIATAVSSAAVICGAYRIAHLAVETLGVVTNKTPMGAYRGFGQPEAIFALERAIDIAAARLQLDPAEIRRRNLVRPEEMPYTSATGFVLDSGRYAELLDLTLERLDYPAVQREIVEARAQGRLLGVGLAVHLEGTNYAPSSLMGVLGIQDSGFDTAVVRMEPSGQARVFTSQTPMGQGIETALAQICADELGLTVADVAVAAGDTFNTQYSGYGTAASRGAGVSGAAVRLAARKVGSKLRQIAGHLLEASADDIEAVPGGFGVRGVPGRWITTAAIAQAAYTQIDLPSELEPGLEARCAYDPPGLAVAYGVAAVVVEVVPDTGRVQLRRIVFGHDCGPQINPRIVEGQVRGAIVQAIGGALYEELPFAADGRPLVTNLRQYPVPSAADVPPIELLHLETPSPFALNGVKGVGESGIIPIPAAIANAVQHALPPGAPLLTSLPLRPDTILAALDPASFE